jgi:hypothetical protein
MIEIRLDAATGLATLTFAGVQSDAEIGEAAAAFIRMVEGHETVAALCDWSEVIGWACEPRSLPVYEWVAVAGRIERAAIVHHHRWNRQAAWLAALIRYGSGDVRSWRPGEADAARCWLAAASDTSAAS